MPAAVDVELDPGWVNTLANISKDSTTLMLHSDVIYTSVFPFLVHFKTTVPKLECPNAIVRGTGS